MEKNYHIDSPFASCDAEGAGFQSICFLSLKMLTDYNKVFLLDLLGRFLVAPVFRIND